jgi:hypothetical protein
VKERLKERKKRVRINDEVDEDFERAIDEQNEAQKREEMEKLSAELKQLQKVK